MSDMSEDLPLLEGKVNVVDSEDKKIPVPSPIPSTNLIPVTSYCISHSRASSTQKTPSYWYSRSRGKTKAEEERRGLLQQGLL